MDMKNYFGLITPRPTVCISTLGPEGNSNIGPYSFVSPLSFNPPLLGVSAGKEKDSLLNARETGDFVIAPLTESWMEKGIESEVSLDRTKSEFEEVGLSEEKSKKVRSPGVEEAPVNLECEYWDDFEVGDHHWLVGKVVHISADEGAVKNGRLNIEKVGSVCHVRGEEFTIPQDIEIIER
ncbi:MAG: flavin reductase family protein [Candidatus Thermoplasmatota archaeon]